MVNFVTCIGLAKKCLQFLSKNKRHIFHFHDQLYWTTYSLFCSTTLCHFSGNFTISSSQNFLSFWAKNFSRCLLQSSRELKFFPLREFCKDRNKWKSEGVMSGEYGRWIRTSQPSCNSFCLVIKKTCGLALSWCKIMRFLSTNSRRFLSSAAFSWSNWEQYFLELIIDFPERARNRGLPSNPTIYTSSSLDEDRPFVWLVVVHFACPTISSVPHYWTVSTCHRLSQFVLKTERFHYF